MHELIHVRGALARVSRTVSIPADIYAVAFGASVALTKARMSRMPRIAAVRKVAARDTSGRSGWGCLRREREQRVKEK